MIITDDSNELLTVFVNNFSKYYCTVDKYENEKNNNPFSNFIFYKLDNNIVGFINYYDLYDRIEIVNFEVLNNYRKKGIGSILLQKVIEIALEKNYNNITLEVNVANNNAISLYEKYGFKNVAIRSKYYGDNDGILMERKMI